MIDDGRKEKTTLNKHKFTSYNRQIKHLIPPLADVRIEIPQKKEENSQKKEENDLKVKSSTWNLESEDLVPKCVVLHYRL